jgi:hypothetical protein
VDKRGNVLTYNGTRWSSPHSIDPSGGGLASVSCLTASLCVAVDKRGNVLTYNGTRWSSPHSIDPSGGGLASVSCLTASLCVAVDKRGNVLTYNGTRWSSPHSIDPSGGGLASVSCPTASLCVAVDNKGNALTYNGTRWSSPHSIDPRSGGLASVSCPTASFCAAVDLEGNALTYDNSSWSSPDSIDPGFSLESVSCPSASTCTAVDGTSTFRWMPPSATTITSVTPNLVLGQPVTVRVQVSGLTTTVGSPTPTGKVTVTDGRRDCLAALSGSHGVARGSCSITEKTAGRYSLKASYPGDTIFRSSSTPRSTPLTIGRATSKTSLGLSSTTVTYGQEQTERLSVTVSPQFPGSSPTGVVAIKESTTAVCAITLSLGKGSCRLSANKLKAGLYHVVATYDGSGNFRGSASVKKILNVVI